MRAITSIVKGKEKGLEQQEISPLEWVLKLQLYFQWPQVLTDYGPALSTYFFRECKLKFLSAYI
jgi:hypothetical protein